MANPTLEMMHGMLYGKGLRFGKLSGLGRTIAMMTGDHADMIPFMGPQIHDHAMTIAKVPARKYYWDAELLVNVQIAVDRWYGFDTYTIIADAYNFEVEALGAKMIYSDLAMPTVDFSQPLITEKTDLDKLGPFDPSRGRIPMSVEVGRLSIQKAPGPFSGGFFCSHWSMLCQAMSYPRAVRAMKRDRVFTKDLFDWANDQVLFPYMQAYAKVGVKNANGADAWAAFPQLTPDLVDEWVVPYSLRLKERCKKELGMTVAAGAAAGDYCEENPEKFDKEIMFKCWDVAHKTMPLDVAFSGMGRTQDWDMHWLQEFAVSRGKGGQKVPIMASLNGRFMRDSSPEAIVAKIREWVDIMARDGRILMFIANVPADTDPLHIHTAVQALHTLSRYPIAADLSKVRLDPPVFQPFDQWLKDQPEADVIFKAREAKPAAEKVVA